MVFCLRCALPSRYSQGATVLSPFHQARTTHHGGTFLRLSRIFTISCLTVVALIALGGQAFSVVTNYAVVGACTAPNPPTHPTEVYATISAAVTAPASVAGTVIEICPGTYQEQVVITKKLTLDGVASPSTSDAVVIAPPAGGMVANATDLDVGDPIAAQVLVLHATGVLIENLTIDGTGNQLGCTGTDFMGLLFQNAGGTVNHVAVREQIPGDVLTGCQIGESIYVQTAPTFSSKVTIEYSSVHNYNKNGITGNDANTDIILTENVIQGSGLSAIAAQNGIQVCCGATANIGSNTVIDNVYSNPAAYAAADILLYDTAENSGLKVYDNILGNSELPVVLYTDFAYGPTAYGDGVSVTTNHIFGTSSFDAIDVCTNGNTITGNTITNSAESGVHLDASCGSYFSGPPTGNNNVASPNTILESYCAGVLADPGTTGNSTGGETFWTVPFTITNSSAACTIPPLQGQVRAAGPHRFSPKR